MVLAGYGGASLLFFGVSPTAHGAESTSTPSRTSEETQLAHAIDASEAEAAGDPPRLDAQPSEINTAYSWWDVLLGKHDQEIFERFANTPVGKAEAEIKAKMRTTAVCIHTLPLHIDTK